MDRTDKVVLLVENEFLRAEVERLQTEIKRLQTENATILEGTSLGFADRIKASLEQRVKIENLQTEIKRLRAEHTELKMGNESTVACYWFFSASRKGVSDA